MVEELVPKYFVELIEKNSEQHKELGERIEKLNGELKADITSVKGDVSWRILWVSGVVIGSLTLGMGLFTALG